MLTVCPFPPVLLLVPPQASNNETAAVLLRPTAIARSRKVRREIRPMRICLMISSMTSPCSMNIVVLLWTGQIANEHKPTTLAGILLLRPLNFLSVDPHRESMDHKYAEKKGIITRQRRLGTTIPAYEMRSEEHTSEL